MWAAKYFKVFYIQQSARIGKDLEHLYNFLVTWSGALCFFVFHIISYSFIISKFQFPGWPVSHLWVLLATFEIVTYAVFFLLWRGQIHTVRELRSGSFDVLMAKPISPRFLAFFRSGGAHNLFSSVLGVLFLVYILAHYQLPVSFLSVVGYLLSIVLAIWVFHCASLLFICLNFFFGYLPFTQGAMFQIQEIYKYPASIFSRSGFPLKLLAVPLTALMSLPASLLLLQPVPVFVWFIYLSFALVVTLASHFLWRYSLRHYSSAG